ncbi:MAG: hypothetical protein ABIY55_17520 [Kofleriaceae bacterium]
MRSLWFIVLIAACRIPTENFVKGDGGGGGSDGGGGQLDARDAIDASQLDGATAIDASTLDAAPDAPPFSMIAQRAYIKSSNTGTNDLFGDVMAMSADGRTLVVGAKGESSAAPGINGNQADNTAAAAGAVYVFTRVGDTWTQQAYL